MSDVAEFGINLVQFIGYGLLAAVAIAALTVFVEMVWRGR
jgi:hypothetical protein